MQALAVVQDTAVNLAPFAPSGSGALCVVHSPPLRSSITGTSPPAERPLPTAVQTVVVGQDTPSSLGELTPAGFFVVGWAQLLPFHLSARVTSSSFSFLYEPTAEQAVVEAQARALILLS